MSDYDALIGTQVAQAPPTPRGAPTLDLTVTPQPIVGAPNEYVAVVVELEAKRQERIQARANILGAQGASPETTAKAIDLGRRVGLPPEVVERNMPEVQREASIDEYVKFLKDSPGLTKWLQDPTNAKVAGADYEKLGTIDRGVNEMKRTMLSTQADMGALGALHITGRLRKLQDLRDRKSRGEFLTRFDQIMLDQESVIRNESRQLLMDSLGQYFERKQEAAEIPVRPAIKAMQEAAKKDDYGAMWDAFAKDPLGVIFDSTAQSLPLLPAQIGAGIVAGPGGAGGVSFIQEYVTGIMDVLDEMKIDTANPAAILAAFSNDKLMAEVRAKAAVKGIVVGAFDAASFGLAGKTLSFGVKSATARHALNIPVQVGVQGTLGGAGEALGSLAAGRRVDPMAVVQEVLGEAGMAPVEVGGAKTWRRLHAEDATRAQWEKFAALPPLEQQSTLAAMYMDKLVATANDTKLATIAPDKLQDFVRSVSEADQTVFIPAEVVNTYLQELPLGQALALVDRLGIAAQIERARITNEDIAIPLANYVTAAREAHATWRQDIRTEVDGFSIRQAQEWEKTRAEEIKAAIARFEEQIQAGIAEGDPQARVYEHVRDQLRIAGRFTNEVSAQYAALYAARYGARAARNPGRYADAWDAFQQAGTGRGMRIESVLPDGIRALGPNHLDVMLDSIRSGKDPLNPPALDAHVDAQREAADAVLGTVLPAPPAAPKSPAQQAAERRAAALEAFKVRRQEVADALQTMGLDVKKMTNAQVRAAIEKARAAGAAGRTFEQSSQKPRIVSSKAMQEKVLREEWRRSGPDLDYDDIWATPAGNRLWEREVAAWNEAHGTRIDPDDYRFGSEPEFEKAFDDKHLKGKKPPFPGVKKANEWFEDHAYANDGEPLRGAYLKGEEPSEFLQQARGSITFAENGAIIRLFQGRDLSTLIHESGHLWLNELESDAKDPAASEQAKADWQAVLDFVGSTDGYITRDQHELFARAFETYTMEGKAPSEGLRAAFRSFKNWLIGIYRQLARLQAPISPEMRQVFDRLLATDEEIANAKNAQGLNPVFTDAKSGEMTEAEFKAYTRAVNQAESEAEQKLMEKVMASIRRERTKEVAAERKRIRGEVTAELMKDPGNAALHFLRTGSLWEGETPDVMKGQKMARAPLVEMLGEEGLKRLPPGSYAETGANPDDMAQLFGLANGRELTERLMQIQAEQAAMGARGDSRSVINARIAEETQRRLTETLGDPLNDGTIEAEALAAVNGEKRGPLLGIELRMLARKAGHSGAISLDNITTWAADTIGAMSSYQAVQFAKYQRAERVAGQQVQRALIKGDMQAAFQAKQDQVVNWALYREAKKAADDTEKTRKLADRYASARTIPNMDQPTLDAIHELLEEFDFKRRGGALLAERTLFTAWAAQQAAAGVQVIEPPRLKGAQSKHYSQMTMEELRGLHDTIAQMAHLGRWKKEMIVAGQKRALDAVLTVMESTAGAISQRGVSQFRRGQSELQKAMGEAGHQFRSGVSALIKMERLFEILDNDKTGRGIFSQAIFRRLADAQTVEYDMRVDLNKKLQAIYAKVPKEQLRKWTEAHTIRDLGAKLTKEEMIVVALNIGSQSNLDKMLQGEGWGEAPMRAMLDKHLTKEEWQFTQDIRDLIGSLWPQTEALEKRVNGVAPEKVEALEVPTPFGLLPGGYYPMVYDRAGSLKADKIARKQATTVAVGELFASGYARPTTRAGSTHERIENFNAPLKLSLSTIGQHINEVSHDLASREAVMDIYKLITNDRFRTAVQSAVGVEYEAQILPWLQRIANEWVQDRVGLDGIDKFLKAARMNTTLVGMGFRLSTMLSQVAGFGNSVQRLGLAGMTDGLRAMGQDPKAMADAVFAKSGEMRNRMNNLERDARANMERFQGKDGIKAALGRFAFRGIALFDMAVSLPTWMGAYNQGLKQGMTEEEAVYYGDKMVRDTQGAGGAKDMSSVQSGSEAWKLFTMFYSYFNVFFNAQIGIRNDLRNAKGFSDYMDVINQTMWLMVIPTLLAAFLSGQGPEKDEDLWAWALRNVGFGVFSGVPYARDLGNAASNQIAGKGFGGAKLSPVQGIGDSVLHLGGDIVKLLSGDDVSKSAIKNIFNFTGLFVGLPTGQLGASSQYVWDVLISGSENPQNIIEWMKGLTFGAEHKK